MSTGRDHARVNLGIWGDDDFRNLTPVEQHLYFVLWTSPNLSYCGSGDWLPKRLAKFAGGWTPDQVEASVVGLEHEKFVIVDRDTDEFLLRSWVKHDGLWKTPNMAVSVANARAALGSQVLRGVVVHEMTKLKSKHPDSGSWRREAVASMLEQDDVDPSEIQTINPPQGLAQPLGQPLARHSAPLLSFSSPTTSPTTSPATAHASRAPVPARRESRAEIRLRELNATARSAAADHVATKFNEWTGSGIPSQTLVEVAIEVDRLMTDGIDPRQIADGIKAWHASNRIYPSQIPAFVAKAARPTQPDAKPTKATLRAVDTMTAAEQIIAAMETA